jgi:homoserine O-acetyltransferase
MKTARILTALLLLALSLRAQNPPLAGGSQQFARLGDCTLQNGQVIRDCRIGYRTFGKLNAAGSNAVLFPTWFVGRSQDLADLIGPGKLVDSGKYFVIAVDALGDGVSSSPSNSRTQPRMRFPRFTIRDMVETQHQLLTRVLHIRRLHAVVGISMGGMQAFQWAVSYPEFMDKVVPIVGSPRPTAYDLLLAHAIVGAIERDPEWNHGNYTKPPENRELEEITQLALTTPAQYNRETTREAFQAWLKQPVAGGFDANDRIRQAQAILALDVSAPFGGAMERAAAAVKAPMLVIVSARDHMVNPAPALEFARLVHARTLVLENDCGHLGPGCEMPKVSAAVAEFLEQ